MLEEADLPQRQRRNTADPLHALLRSCVARIDSPHGFVGSGFVVAPGEVLTCAHVVADANEFTVHGDGWTSTATVTRRVPELSRDDPARTFHPLPDVALLQLDTPPDESRCVRLEPGHPTIGPPAAVLRIDAFTQGEHHPLRVVRSPAATVYEGPLEEEGTVLLKLADGQVLRGYSGAPVLDVTSGSVCAIVDSTRDPGSDLGGFGVPIGEFADAFDGLLARNAAFHQADRHWARAVEAQAEQAARLAGHRDALPLLATQIEMAGEVRDRQSDLLRPRHRVVPMVGRERFMSHLALWREADSPLEVAFLTGGGGFGKTRLAVEACIAAEQTGWTAGLLDGGAVRTHPERLAWLTKWPGRLFAAIDYAETRPETVRELLRELQRRSDRPAARVVLICRQALEREKLEDLFGGGDAQEELGAVLSRAEPFRLPTEELDRTELFRTAVEAFKARLPGTVDVAAQVSLREEHFARPLFVSVASLLACQHADLDIDALGEEELMLEVIDRHETRYWEQMADRHRLVLDQDAQRSSVAVATLVGARDEADAVALVDVVPGFSDATGERKRAIATWLSSLYASGTLSASPAIGALEPDPLAEALIARELRARPQLITGVLSLRSVAQLSHALAVLTRVSERRTDLQAAVRETLDAQLGALVERAVSARASDQELLGALTATVLAIRPSAGAAMTDLEFSAYGEGFLQLARLLADLAVQHWRGHAESEPERFLPKLALALNNQSNLLAEAGRPADGLAPSDEAVGYYRRLAEADPERFLPELAMALNNRANRLVQTGRPADGLAPSDEAVGYYRRLAEADPQRFLPNLAGTLNNQSSLLGQAGRPADGLAPSGEAVGYYRELAEADPQRFLPDLAMALNNQANLLAEAGRPADGLAPIEEAVRYRRQLAEADPQRFVPDLATSLNNQSSLLAQAGRPADGRAPSEEAVGYYRRLAEADPQRFVPDLAMALNNYSSLLAQAGRPADGLAPIEEAVRYRRQLAEADPQRFLPDLARSLNNYANRLAQAGRPAEGLPPIEEALAAVRGEWATGVLLTVRARYHERVDNLDAAVVDAWNAFEHLEHSRDALQHARARRLLRWMRSQHRVEFDLMWEAHIPHEQPLWLQHPAVDRAVLTPLAAWVDTATWEESERFLTAHADVLLADPAIAALDHLLDDHTGAFRLSVHLNLLKQARASGVESAYAQLRAELRQAELIELIGMWLRSPSTEDARRLLDGPGAALLSEDVERLIEELANAQPAQTGLLGRLALLSLARLDGPRSAFSIPNTFRVVPEAAAEDPGARTLAHARLAVAASPADPEASLAHAIAAAATGRGPEAAHAAERLRKNTNSWERREHIRRLTQLQAAHPALAPALAEVRAALEARSA